MKYIRITYPGLPHHKALKGAGGTIENIELSMPKTYFNEVYFFFIYYYD